MLQRLTLATEYFLAQQDWTAIYAFPVGGNLSYIANMDVTICLCMTEVSVCDQKHEFASYGVGFLGLLEIHACTPLHWK
jgi:hypothetical protein